MAKRRRKKKKKIKFLFLFIILVGIIIGGFYGLNYFKDPQVEDEEEEVEKEVEIPEVKIVDTKSKTRPFAVMINNLGAARPYHTGLQEAYLVYEIVVEGGITRYLALYKDNYPEVVGSVRSARHYYLDYVLENDAYYVHWGWSPQAQEDIKTLGINNLNGLSLGSPYFFRKKLNVSSEHTGYANLAEMVKYVETKNWHQDDNKGLLLKYSALSVDMGSDAVDASKIDLKYSNSFTTNYTYDSQNGVYMQSVNGKEHVDYESKKVYSVKNIITYQVGNKTISGDDKGRQDLDNIGSGTGYFISEGKAVEITWEKKNRSSQTVYKYKNGEEIKVNDGNTWIHIVPKTGNISIS